MRVAVVGSGAMGSLFGGLLADDGATVTLIDVREPHVDVLDREGVTIESPEGEVRTIPVDATTDPTDVAAVDLAFVFVKGVHTRKAVADAAGILHGATVVTLQNGLGNPEEIATVAGWDAIVAGVTAHGATLLGPGRVRHAGRGPTTVGDYFGGDDGRAVAVADRLTDAGIETDVSPEIERQIWEKVAVNVGINAATALARVENGRLDGTEPGRRLLEAAIEECVAVAAAEGHELRGDVAARAREVARATATNRSSMRQDVEAGRRTEIERLNGEVVRRAERHGLSAPVNRTLTDLIRLAGTESTTPS